MVSIRTSGELVTTINTNLADNNAGSISAADVRTPLADLAYSIVSIVSSGDMDVAYPYYNDVRLKSISGDGGTLITESGILFPNSNNNPGARQVEPFLGIHNLNHNNLAGLTTGNPHTNYVHVDGTNVMTGNLRLGNNWVGASGNSNMGVKFIPNASGTEDVNLYGTASFQDNSRIDTFKGSAKAWINFDGSGIGAVPVVRDSFNIDAVQRTAQGKYKITFTSGIFGNNNYVVSATSNATTASGSQEDFDLNTVGCVSRIGDDSATLRSCTFLVRNDNGEYVDSEVNDFIVYGRGPNETADSTPTVS